MKREFNYIPLDLNIREIKHCIYIIIYLKIGATLRNQNKPSQNRTMDIKELFLSCRRGDLSKIALVIAYTHNCQLY